MNRAVSSFVVKASATRNLVSVGGMTSAPLYTYRGGNTLAATSNNAASMLLKRAVSTVFGKYYQIEASNAERHDATKLTVRGPDVDGILASMTVALAVKGCSLVEMHAAAANDCSHDHVVVDEHLIKDTFYVVSRKTGKQFEDGQLHALAEALLEAAKSPMTSVSMSGAEKEMKNLEAHLEKHVQVPETQITVIPSAEAA
jgi:hypothetical protein